MRPAATLFCVGAVLMTAGCAVAKISDPPDGGRLDGAQPDGASLDAERADAVVTPPPPPARPTNYRDLHPTCGAWSYDLADPTTYDTPEELAVALSEARCERAIRCGYAYESWDCDPVRLRPSAELHAPVDVALAATCLRALGACDYAAFGAAEALCTGLHWFWAENGHACDDDGQCASSHCEAPTGTCGGTCAAPPPPAPPCGGPCPTGEVCTGAGTCSAPLREGETCSTYFGLVPCADGLMCTGVRCARLPTDGEPCLPVSMTGWTILYCAAGHVCDGLTCALSAEVALGEACSVARTCPAGTACVDGTCQTLPTEGESCAGFGTCERGFVCDGTTWRCGRVVGPGCACSDVAVCPSGFFCSDGACERIGTVPTSCADADTDCLGAPCLDGLCDVRFVGDLCDDAHPCVEGRCSRLIGSTTERCLPVLASGADCHSDQGGCVAPQTCHFGFSCTTPQSVENPCRDVVR
jgi:hypothetical protein